MTHELAAQHKVSIEPNLSLDVLRALRAEADALLRFLRSDSGIEEAKHDAQRHGPTARSVRSGRAQTAPTYVQREQLAGLVEALLREIAAALTVGELDLAALAGGAEAESAPRRAVPWRRRRLREDWTRPDREGPGPAGAGRRRDCLCEVRRASERATGASMAARRRHRASHRAPQCGGGRIVVWRSPRRRQRSGATRGVAPRRPSALWSLRSQNVRGPWRQGGALSLGRSSREPRRRALHSFGGLRADLGGAQTPSCDPR